MDILAAGRIAEFMPWCCLKKLTKLQVSSFTWPIPLRQMVSRVIAL
jgi:hypothetical protein